MPIKLQIHHPDRMVVGVLQGAVTADDLAAFSDRMHAAPLAPEHAPFALMSDKQNAPLADLFARLMGDDRPVRVLGSIHAARQWLHDNSRIT